MITPGTLDQYSRYMVEMFDDRNIIPNTTVWQTFFGNPAHGSRTVYSPDSDVLDIDIIRGNKRIAALVQRGTNSRNLNTKRNTVTQNFSSFSRTYPFAEEIGDITATQILKRVAGENPYDRMSKQERTRILAREHHLEHIRRYVRLFEALAGQSLLGGQMNSLIGNTDTNYIYDWCRNNALIATPAVPWDAAGADILGDIDNAHRQVYEIGSVKPNVGFFADDVANVFFNSTVLQKLADIKGFSFIRAGENNPLPAALQPLKDAGATYRGFVQTPVGSEFHLFTYWGTYEDSDGVSHKYLPDGYVFFGYYGARCDRYFGPPERLPVTRVDEMWYQDMFGMNMAAMPMPTNISNAGQIIDPNMFYSDAYASDDRKKVSVRTQSAPIFVTTQTDAFFTLYNVLEVSS